MSQSVDNSRVAGNHEHHRYHVHNHNIKWGENHFSCVAAVDAPRNTRVFDDVRRKIVKGYEKHRHSNPDEQNCTNHDIFLHLQLQNRPLAVTVVQTTTTLVYSS